MEIRMQMSNHELVRKEGSLRGKESDRARALPRLGHKALPARKSNEVKAGKRKEHRFF